jgi:hypothetical protein
MINPGSSAVDFLRSEDGTASIEFLLTFPLVTTIFLASFETSFYTVRHVLLERSLDIVMRELRLGMIPAVTHAKLKKEICARAPSLLIKAADCENNLKVWLQPIDTTSFNMPTTPTTCIDRSQPMAPQLAEPANTEFDAGTAGDLMLVRVCLKEDPMFGATTAVGAGLTKDVADGGYIIATMSVFVNEPGK